MAVVSREGERQWSVTLIVMAWVRKSCTGQSVPQLHISLFSLPRGTAEASWLFQAALHFPRPVHLADTKELRRGEER